MTQAEIAASTTGSGEPLVLLHGLGHSRHAWFPVLEALESRHEVLSLDLPGFGEALPLPAGVVPTVPALADAVEREMDAAGFRTAHVAGNSMGGWIALELARRGRARTVVAISPAGGGTRRERAYARSLMKAIRMLTRVVSPLARAVSIPGPTRTVFFGVFFARPNRLPREEAAYALRAYAHAPAFPAACDWLVSRRAHRLDRIDCPVTIAWGTRDLPAASSPGSSLSRPDPQRPPGDPRPARPFTNVRRPGARGRGDPRPNERPALAAPGLTG